MPDINWSVVTNGLDFMESAVEQLAAGNDHDLRHAALHLSTAIETILKARLAREHWTLVVSDVDNARRASYETGDFQSVTIDQALKRLREVVGSSFSEEEVARIKSAAKLRNRVAHFALHDDNPRATEATVARGLDVLLHFISRELRPGAGAKEAEAVDATLEHIREQIGKINALVRERMNTLREALNSAPPPVLACPGCAQGTYVLGHGEAGRCLYCLYQREGDVSAADYATTVLGESQYEVVKHGEAWSVYSCIECGSEAFVAGVVPVSHGGDEIIWACFACGYSCTASDVEDCARCGEITHAETDGLAVCSNCEAAYFAD
jgi:hypothetical protein